MHVRHLRDTSVAASSRPSAALTLLLVLMLVVGCATPSPDAGAADGPTVSARADGELLLVDVDGVSRVVAHLDVEDGEVVHASVRPGPATTTTVVAVTRVDDPAVGPRFELRYVVVGPGEVGELDWFPRTLQVEATTAEALDVVPTPVWAPDGRALAWVEWTAEETRLRTVTWSDAGPGQPQLHAAGQAGGDLVQALADVPAGMQLQTWIDEDDGTAVLAGRHAGQPYRLRLAALGAGHATV